MENQGWKKSLRGKKIAMNILIVDDSSSMRSIVKTSIHRYQSGGEKHDYYEAENGKIALDIMQMQEIDILLLDWNMPELDGLELVEKVRSMRKYVSIPIIMVTAMTSRYDVITAIKAGVTDYVMKPVRDESLWEKIMDYFTDNRE